MGSDLRIEEIKAQARKNAFAARKAAHDVLKGQDNCAQLRTALRPFEGQAMAGFMPIRTEISPLPIMTQWAQTAPVAVPVIRAAGQPLVFSRWFPDGALVDGPFGAMVPQVEDLVIPSVLIVPLVAFDEQGGRLGYGGGFYDRTLEGLRARGQVTAIGFAYDAQQQSDLPLEPTDQPLDMIVTQSRILVPNPS